MTLLASQLTKQVLQCAVFCATTSSSVIGAVFSDDAINFSSQHNSAAIASGSFSSVAYGNGIFVAVAGLSPGGVAYISNDGINWSAGSTIPTLSTYSWHDIVFSNGVFVVTGSYSSGATTGVAYSTDGINWSTVGSAFSSTGLVSVANSGTFYTSASGGVAAYSSTNGSTWTAVGTNFPGALGDALLVQDSNGGSFNMLLPYNVSTTTTTYYTAPAGTFTWTARTLNTAIGFVISCFAYGNSTYVIAGEDSSGNCQIQTSSTGTGSWTTTNIVGQGTTIGLKFINGLFVLAVRNTGGNQVSIYTSSNGTSWTLKKSFTGLTTIPLFAVLNP